MTTKRAIYVEQGSPEWHDLRQNKIGASDAPVIMGVSPWNTPYQLYEIKKGTRTVEMNSAMQRGNEMEHEARLKFEEATKLIVMPAVILHPEYDWMMASLDGIDIEEKYIVEIKCPGIEDHELARSGKVPEKYYPQLQHQLEVAGLDMVYYFSYRPESYALIEVKRDQDYIDKMVEKELAFWTGLQQDSPPSLIDRDYEEKDDIYWDLSANAYLESVKMRKFYESQEETYKQKLIEMSGQRNCKGCGVRLTKYKRVGAINYGAIPELIGVDLEAYRKPGTETYRITEIE